jgi:hypothetical protein
MAKKRKLRDLRDLPTDTTGAKLKIGRTIELNGVTYNPGDAPPANIRDDPGLGSMLRKGYLISDVELNTKLIRPTPKKTTPKKTTPKKPKIAEPVFEDVDAGHNGEIAILKDLSKSNSLNEIRAAFDMAGVDYPEKAKRKALLELRDQIVGEC